jgi:hypothetical protein
MSLRYEQYNALKITKQFLVDLLFSDTRPKNITELKRRASNCLRHYPFLSDTGKPLFSQDDLTDD